MSIPLHSQPVVRQQANRVFNDTPWLSKGHKTHIHSHTIHQRRSYSAASVTADALVVFFQQVLSPQDGPVCRFEPTCSRYGKEAFEKHGFFKGLLMTTDRLVRDNPFALPQKDPVPEPEKSLMK